VVPIFSLSRHRSERYSFIADKFMPLRAIDNKSRLAVLLGVAALDLPTAIARRSLLIAGLSQPGRQARTHAPAQRHGVRK
jgi:hypothetical protein